MVSQPLIGVVVVNYFGGERTIGCLEAVLKSTWPADRLRVVLVDNGSEPGFRDEVETRLPAVEWVGAPENLGFGGGCNLGIGRLPDCDHVALINNDAIPEPDWLEPLVELLERQPNIGAVSPKVLLTGTFVTVALRSPTTRPGAGDVRELGVQLCGARVGGVDVTSHIKLGHGFWGWEHDDTTIGGAFAWTDGNARAHLPVPDGAHHGPVEVSLQLACGNGPLAVDVAGADVDHRLAIGIQPGWFEIGNVVRTHALVNNAGTVLLSDGSVGDAGFLEPDDGGFDDARETFGWSGAAVLLRRSYLDDVGLFDARFFLYYEDGDLSWRGRLRGWTYWCEPRAIVRHEHSATVGGRSDLVRHLAARNRLVMLTKVAPRRLVAGALRDLLRQLARTVWMDVLLRLAHGRRPVLLHLTRTARVLSGFVQLGPATLRLRRHVRRTATEDDRAVLCWSEA